MGCSIAQQPPNGQLCVAKPIHSDPFLARGRPPHAPYPLGVAPAQHVVAAPLLAAAPVLAPTVAPPLVPAPAPVAALPATAPKHDWLMKLYMFPYIAHVLEGTAFPPMLPCIAEGQDMRTFMFRYLMAGGQGLVVGEWHDSPFLHFLRDFHMGANLSAVAAAADAAHLLDAQGKLSAEWLRHAPPAHWWGGMGNAQTCITLINKCSLLEYPRVLCRPEWDADGLENIIALAKAALSYFNEVAFSANTEYVTLGEDFLLGSPFRAGRFGILHALEAKLASIPAPPVEFVALIENIKDMCRSTNRPIITIPIPKNEQAKADSMLFEVQCTEFSAERVAEVNIALGHGLFRVHHGYLDVQVGWNVDTSGKRVARWMCGHALLYSLTKGMKGVGTHVAHLCHNRKCLNLAHLVEVPPSYNASMREVWGLTGFHSWRDGTFVPRDHSIDQQDLGGDRTRLHSAKHILDLSILKEQYAIETAMRDIKAQYNKREVPDTWFNLCRELLVPMRHDR